MPGPTATLEFAGDETKLTRATKAASSAVQDMGKSVAGASDGFQRTGRSAEDWAEKTDAIDTKAMGFRDTLTGLQDSFTGLSDPSQSFGDRLLTLGFGIGDLASGFTNFLIPQMSQFWTWLTATTAAQWATSTATAAWNLITKATAATMGFLNQVIKANPILFLVGLIIVLVGAFATLWQHSEGFRRFFIGMWNGIKAVVLAVIGGIKAGWDGVVDFFTHFPTRIGQALSGLGGLLSGVFKGAVNGLVDGINWFVDHSVNWLIDRLNDISGLVGVPAIPHVPHIPRMHTGGVVHGSPGTEQLILARAGERVSTGTSGGGGGGGTVRFEGDTDSAFARAFMMLVRLGVIQLA